MNLWNRDTALLLALIVLGAIWAVVHVALFLKTWRLPGIPRVLRFLSWLPPLTAVAGFWGGATAWAWLWCIVGAAYLVLRSLA
jgi:hypothetical protein